MSSSDNLPSIPLDQCTVTPAGVDSVIKHLREHPAFARQPEACLYAAAVAFVSSRALASASVPPTGFESPAPPYQPLSPPAQHPKTSASPSTGSIRTIRKPPATTVVMSPPGIKCVKLSWDTSDPWTEAEMEAWIEAGMWTMTNVPSRRGFPDIPLRPDVIRDDALFKELLEMRAQIESLEALCADQEMDITELTEQRSVAIAGKYHPDAKYISSNAFC